MIKKVHFNDNIIYIEDNNTSSYTYDKYISNSEYNYDNKYNIQEKQGDKTPYNNNNNLENDFLDKTQDQIINDVYTQFIEKYPHLNNSSLIIYDLCKLVVLNLPENNNIDYYLNFIISSINIEKHIYNTNNNFNI